MTFALGAALTMLVSLLGITGSTDGSQAGSSGSPGSSNVNLPSTVSALDPLLIKEFNSWDSKTHVPFPSSQQSRATVLKEFLNNDPYGARIMNKIISIQETGFVPQTSPNATFDEYVIQHGNSTVTSVATYQTNGTVYSVIHVAYSLTVNDKSYRVNAAIIKLPNGNGWGLHVHINGEGLENVLMPLAFGALMSPTISQNAHSFQNQYGTAWTWVGAY